MGDTPNTSSSCVQLAVFDYDGTCISGQSGALFAIYLNHRHYLGFHRGFRLSWWGVRYKLHLPYRQNEAREVIFDALSQCPREEIQKIMVDFHDESLLPRYRPQAIKEIERRHREGCVTVLVSATFNTIAQCAQKVLRTDEVIATDMEIDSEGHYTGKVSGEVTEGAAKPRAIKQWADKVYGPRKWEIAYAYGDHFSDEAMLSAARKGYAVTPDKTMRKIARRCGFTILNWK